MSSRGGHCQRGQSLNTGGFSHHQLFRCVCVCVCGSTVCAQRLAVIATGEIMSWNSFSRRWLTVRASVDVLSPRSRFVLGRAAREAGKAFVSAAIWLPGQTERDGWRQSSRQATEKTAAEDTEPIRNVTDSLDGLWLHGRPPTVDPH